MQKEVFPLTLSLVVIKKIYEVLTKNERDKEGEK